MVNMYVEERGLEAVLELIPADVPRRQEVADHFRRHWVAIGDREKEARREAGVYLIALSSPILLNDGCSNMLLPALDYSFADFVAAPPILLIPLVDSCLVHFDDGDKGNDVASVHDAKYATLPGKRYGRTENPLELQKMAAIAWDLKRDVTDVAVVEHGNLRTVVFSGEPMLYHELLTSETVIYEAAGTADDGTQAIDQSSSTHRGTRLGLCFPGAVHRVGAYNFEPDVRSVAGISNDPKTGPALLRAYPNPHKYSGSQPPESQFSFLRPQRTEAASLSTFDIAFAHYRNEGSPFFSAATQALTDARLLRD